MSSTFNYMTNFIFCSDSERESGIFMKTEDPEIIKFTFGGAFDSPIIVTVKFYITPVVNILELTQENMPDTEEGRVKYHLQCCEGWNFYLVNLKSFLEGGIDLRNKDEDMQNMINK